MLPQIKYHQGDLPGAVASSEALLKALSSQPPPPSSPAAPGGSSSPAELAAAVAGLPSEAEVKEAVAHINKCVCGQGAGVYGPVRPCLPPQRM